MDLSVYYEDQGYLFEMKISELEKQLTERDKLIEQMREALRLAPEMRLPRVQIFQERNSQ